ncbi:hypothetical protein AX14_011127 [Amanita brunnescens Koide BX004]|nr:hypothetical protein AX14_011127 [Amanita brunnescens Koide BX004]
MELGMGVEEESSRGDWGDENLQDGSITLAVNEGNDPLDGDWLPYALTKSKKRRTERPKVYAKGPDIMSKSKRTQCRYRKANRETTLDAFMSTARAVPTSVARKFPQSAEVDISSAVGKAASSKLHIYKPSP